MFLLQAVALCWAQSCAPPMGSSACALSLQAELATVSSISIYILSSIYILFLIFLIAGCDPVLGPEMRSTGEVMGIDANFAAAYAKAQVCVTQAAYLLACKLYVRIVAARNLPLVRLWLSASDSLRPSPKLTV